MGKRSVQPAVSTVTDRATNKCAPHFHHVPASFGAASTQAVDPGGAPYLYPPCSPTRRWAAAFRRPVPAAAAAVGVHVLRSPLPGAAAALAVAPAVVVTLAVPVAPRRRGAAAAHRPTVGKAKRVPCICALATCSATANAAAAGWPGTRCDRAAVRGKAVGAKTKCPSGCRPAWVLDAPVPLAARTAPG